MKQKSPEVDIPEGVFYDEIDGYNLYVKHKNRKTGMLYDVLIYNFAIAQGGAICIGHLVGQQRPHAAFILGKYVMKRAVSITLLLSTTIALAGPTILG